LKNSATIGRDIPNAPIPSTPPGSLRVFCRRSPIDCRADPSFPCRILSRLHVEFFYRFQIGPQLAPEWVTQAGELAFHAIGRLKMGNLDQSNSAAEAES